jgi:hypothetical protein
VCGLLVACLLWSADLNGLFVCVWLRVKSLWGTAHTVLSICSSLLAVVKLRDGSPIVQFAHFSVKEYLMSTRLTKAKGSISRFHVSMTPAHSIVAQACLGVLLHLDENITNDGLEKFPLVEYAAEHWVGHARVPQHARCDGMSV